MSGLNFKSSSGRVYVGLLIFGSILLLTVLVKNWPEIKTSNKTEIDKNGLAHVGGKRRKPKQNSKRHRK